MDDVGDKLIVELRTAPLEIEGRKHGRPRGVQAVRARAEPGVPAYELSFGRAAAVLLQQTGHPIGARALPAPDFDNLAGTIFGDHVLKDRRVETPALKIL